MQHKPPKAGFSQPPLKLHLQISDLLHARTDRLDLEILHKFATNRKICSLRTLARAGIVFTIAEEML